ncbi:ALK tyrosine kinase receptor-like [Penaeus chinensis]|uniref:ALK tyrosine kinase receptor-like n=1 Tax=Penaeus chinensis TaxID=139456 RepID=UPI001FB71C82|nr:ALK tyrosine kinase receptor-like [Penaeus chinensis]
MTLYLRTKRRHFEKERGPGGGWIGNRKRGIEGQSLVHGGMGGDSCVPADTWNTYGGFGGGGGGCMAGGGGGGYTGGNAYSGPYRHGEGGYSYTSGEFEHVTTTRYKGPGVVYIIPAVRRHKLNTKSPLPLDTNIDRSKRGLKEESV